MAVHTAIVDIHMDIHACVECASSGIVNDRRTSTTRTMTHEDIHDSDHDAWVGWGMVHAGLQIGLSPAILGPFSGYRAKLFTRVILGPAQRNYIEKGTLPPKSAPQNKIVLKFLLQNVEIFRRQPSPVSIGLSPICSPAPKSTVIKYFIYF